MPPPLVLRDAEGDILNTGTGTGKPAKDLSLNFVPVSYPNYQPAVIKTKPSETQLWRVLNASAITYLDLQVLAGGMPQLLGVVSLDGIPLDQNGNGGRSHHLGKPRCAAARRAGRSLFSRVCRKDARGSLVTRSVDTGPAGENDPTRPLATIVAAPDAPEPRSRLAASPAPLPPPTTAWLGNVRPVRVRKLYFSEQPQDPSNPE